MLKAMENVDLCICMKSGIHVSLCLWILVFSVYCLTLQADMLVGCQS